MNKRILALVCMLALLIGVFAIGATASTDGDGKYDVGYAKVDVNPWVQSDYVDIGIPAQYTDADGNLVDYTDAATSIIDTDIYDPDSNLGVETPLVKVQLSGYGAATTRLAETVSDDNGDGKVTVNGDGLQVTVTSVTDDWGKTVMYITIDSLGGYVRLARAVRAGIVEALSGAVAESDIMVSASHSHEAPDLDACYSAAAGTALRAYYDYYIDRTVEAAVQAYNTASPANMSKGSIEASDHFGTDLNFVRHYNIHSEESIFRFTTSSHDWVGGDNFGGSFSEDNADGTWSSSSTTLEHVSEANQTMNILQFTRDEGNPIVLIQWQAHPSIMGSKTGTNISSDYINALRYRLENNATKFSGKTDYCVGFWQGTGGNINNTSRISSEYTYITTDPTTGEGWITTERSTVGLSLITNSTEVTTSIKNRTYRNALYGYILGTVALECLNENMVDADMGKIHTIQSKYSAARQQDSEGLVAAATAWRTEYDAGNTITYPYTYTHEGTVYALNSYYHAYNVEQRAKSAETYTTLELNAIVMGENVALVTAPLELFDRYSDEGSFTDNDWDDLIDESYGEPFVLSKTNGRLGYAPNAMAYDYYTDQTGTVAEGTEMGSYEANITDHARGTGEAIVAHFDEMLELAANGYVEGTCPECGSVEWAPLTAESTSTTSFGTGHYYLTEDMPRIVDTQTQKVINDGDVLCINLNGYTMETEGRSFNVKAGGVLNIINTTVKNAGNTGIVRSYSEGNNPSGGVGTIAAGGEFNLYGGTLEFVDEGDSKFGTGVGGILTLTGTMNMYGGTIEGADLVDSSYPEFSADGCGGAIYMYGGSVLNMQGGNITSGSVPTSVDNGTKKGMGPCVFIGGSTAKITLANNASIGDIYYKDNNGSNLTISGTYKGTTNLSFYSTISLDQDLDIGDAINSADISGATITFTDDTWPWKAVVDDTNLLLKCYKDDTVAVFGTTEYSTLQAAVDNYNGTIIKMIRDEANAVTVDEGKDIYLDLNGCSITGAVTVNGNYTLYCKDSKTDDYTVADGNYGKIASATGNVLGIPEASTMADDGYLKVAEDDGISFHRVNLDLTHMTLRAKVDNVCAPGLYYKSNFKGDEKVKAAVKQYGVALSVKEMPNETNMDDEEGTCQYSKFTTFTSGSAGNSGSGTLLKGIMKPTNARLVNNRNANMPVYGRAYILTDDGYMFGGGYDRTLKAQTEAADGMWNNSDFTDSQKQGLMAMYNTYTSIVSKWNMPNLNAYQDNSISILGIGNSYTIDSMWMLGAVYQAENSDKDVKLGIAYKSGATIFDHKTNITNNAAAYNYLYWDTATDTWTVAAEKMTLQDIIKDQQWEMVSMQQGSSDSGRPVTYSANIQTIQTYVEEQLGYAPTYLWNMTWAYPEVDIEGDAYDLETAPNASAFASNYQSSQATMYQAIMSTVQEKIVPNATFEYLMPVGTAIQNANGTLTDHELYRDYTHLSDYGRLLAAYTWYCELERLVLDDFQLKALPTVNCSSSSWHNGAARALTTDELALAIQSVKDAMENKFTTTDTSVYAE